MVATISVKISEIRDKLDIGHLNEDQEQKLYNMLEGVQEVLCKDEYDIGKADVSPHKI